MTKIYSKGFILSVFAAFDLLFATVLADDFAYIFANDAKLIQVDLTKSQVIKRGDLSEIGYNEIFNIIHDPTRHQILLLAARLPTRATRDEPTKTELVILNNQGKLVRAIQDPIQPGDAVQGLVMPDGKKIVLSLYNSGSKKEKIVILDKTTFKQINEINDFRLFESSTVSSDGRKLYTAISGVSRTILRLDLQDTKVRKSSYEDIGHEKYFSKGVITSKNSLALILEHATDPKKKYQPTVFIYDIENERVLSSFQVNVHGERYILPYRRVLFIDEKQWILSPDKPLGTNPGKLGRLHVYSLGSGELLTTVILPEGGKIAYISPDEKTAYYFSPKRLTLIDLEHFKVLKQIEVPFLDGMVAIVKADSSKAAQQPKSTGKR